MDKDLTPRLSYIQVLEKTTPIFNKYFREIALITLITYSFITSLSLLIPELSSFFLLLVTVIITFYLFLIFQNDENNKTVNLDKIFFSKSNFFKLLHLFKPLLFILFLITILTFALFIPAIIFAVFWSFWEFIAIENKFKFKDILEYSRILVSHNWFYHFFYLIIAIFCLNIPPFIIYSFDTDNPIFILISNYLSGLITSYFIIGFIIIYKNLQKKSPQF